MTDIRSRSEVASYGSRGTTVTVVSLVRRGERRTVVFWREGGRRREQTIVGRTRREQESAGRAFAEVKHAALVARVQGGPAAPAAPLTVAELHDRYLLAEAQAWAPATQRNHGARWMKFQDYVGARSVAQDVTLETLDEWRAALRGRHVEAEISRMVTAVKSVYRFGVARDLIVSKVPLYAPKRLLGQGARKIAEFTPAEVRLLLAEMKPRGKKQGAHGIVRPWRPWAICWLTAASAKRCRSQVLPLQWSDVHFTRGGGFIEWPAEHDKLRKEHRQPLPRRAAALLHLVRWLARQEGLRSPYVFPAPVWKRSGPKRKWYAYTGLVYQLHVSCDRAGVARRERRAMHGFRRYAANQVLESGGSIKDAGLWLNDSDLKTLSDSYLRERQGEQEAIARRLPSPDGRSKGAP
jgi:integrase